MVTFIVNVRLIDMIVKIHVGSVIVTNVMIQYSMPGKNCTIGYITVPIRLMEAGSEAFAPALPDGKTACGRPSCSVEEAVKLDRESELVMAITPRLRPSYEWTWTLSSLTT